ncbi:MAG: phosphoglycolate phosphatase [Caulobacter sp.]|nr:phosphoglycolate phosphatase [Caulobacter sp.]
MSFTRKPLTMHDQSKTLAGWTIAFDLDGTLVETAPDLVGALNVILVEQGMAPAPMSAVRQLVGHGLRGMLLRAFAMADLTITEDQIARLRPRIVDVYRARIAQESRPFSGCLEALAALRARGAALAVCTNKPEGLARLLLDELDMTRWFDAIVGGDTLPVQKPDPAPLLEAIARAGGDPAKAILVGDASPDVGAAKAAGLPCVICDFGYNDLPPADLGGDVVISHYDALAQVAADIAASCRTAAESL